MIYGDRAERKERRGAAARRRSPLHVRGVVTALGVDDLPMCSRAQRCNSSTVAESVAPSGVIEYSTVIGTVGVTFRETRPSRSSPFNVCDSIFWRQAVDLAPQLIEPQRALAE